MKLYHITERANLQSILRFGLAPKYDKTLRSKQLGSGTVVNLGSRKVIEEVLWAQPWEDPVLLEVEVPRRALVRLEHLSFEGLTWYASRKTIPPTGIKVIGDPTKLVGYDTWREGLPDPTVGLSIEEIEEPLSSRIGGVRKA